MADYTITITREFDAQRDRVWREWTEPEAFADWFGGPQNEVPLSSVAMEVRPGGPLRLTMYAEPGRREIRWRGEYVEVEPPARLVFTISDQPDGGEAARITVVLTEVGDGRTHMRFEQHGPLPPELYARTEAGWRMFFDRIDERLGS